MEPCLTHLGAAFPTGQSNGQWGDEKGHREKQELRRRSQRHIHHPPLPKWGEKIKRTEMKKVDILQWIDILKII